MVTPEKNSAALQALIDRHPTDLSIILNHLGIQEAPSPLALKFAFTQHGARLVDLLSQLPEENFEGDRKSFYEDLLTSSPEKMPQPEQQNNEEKPSRWMWFLLAFVIVMTIIGVIIYRSSNA
jgi:hypothetical protein